MALRLKFKPGMDFALKNVRLGIHSDETIDFIADLYYNGQLVGLASNNGCGGATDIIPAKGGMSFQEIKNLESLVGVYPFFVFENGHCMYWSLGDIADEIIHNDKATVKKAYQM